MDHFHMQNPELRAYSYRFQPVLFFDGTCMLCNGAVRFVVKHNRQGKLYFATLQSEAWREVVQQMNPGSHFNDTLVLLADNRLYMGSSAVLKTAAYLAFPWSMLAWFRIVPLRLRDAIYQYVARKRHVWFGSETFCKPADSALKQRFLD